MKGKLQKLNTMALTNTMTPRQGIGQKILTKDIRYETYIDS